MPNPQEQSRELVELQQHIEQALPPEWNCDAVVKRIADQVKAYLGQETATGLAQLAVGAVRNHLLHPITPQDMAMAIHDWYGRGPVLRRARKKFPEDSEAGRLSEELSDIGRQIGSQHNRAELERRRGELWERLGQHLTPEVYRQNILHPEIFERAPEELQEIAETVQTFTAGGPGWKERKELRDRMTAGQIATLPEEVRILVSKGTRERLWEGMHGKVTLSIRNALQGLLPPSTGAGASQDKGSKNEKPARSKIWERMRTHNLKKIGDREPGPQTLGE